MYDYVNGESMGFIETFSEFHPEILKQPVKLEEFLNEEFYRGFGTYVYNGKHGKETVETYLKDEERLLEEAKEQKKSSRKSGR